MVQVFTLPEEALRHLECMCKAVCSEEFDVKCATVQLGAAYDKVSVSEWKGGTSETPDANALVRLFSLPSTQAVLALLQEQLGPTHGTLDMASVWLRIRDGDKGATPEHTDLYHFAEDQRQRHSLGDGAHCCCFCGCVVAIVSHACQRCAAGGISTAWLPLHDINKAEHSMLEFGDKPAADSLSLGTGFVFLADELHRAQEGSGLRISIDVRFRSRSLPKVALA